MFESARTNDHGGSTAALDREELRDHSVVWEHMFVMYGDALLLLYELADKQDRRFQAAAARWHARFVLEANLSLSESEMLMNMLRGITGANRHVLRRRLLERVEREGLIARELRLADDRKGHGQT